MQISVVLSVLLAGCQTTMVPLDGTSDETVRISIAVGDTVRVLTKHGDRPTYEVTSITEDALIGDDYQIRYEDMAFIEKRQRGANPGSVVGVILIVAVGAVAVEGLGNIGPGFPAVP